MSFSQMFQDNSIQRTTEILNNVKNKGTAAFSRPPEINANQTGPDFGWERSNNSYAGTDCTVGIIYNEHIVLVNNLETFSYSIFREKNPVKTLGRIYPKNFTYGSRTISGSMIFITFDEHPLSVLFQLINKRTNTTHRFSSPLSDDIPPFDVMLFFHNEYGASSVIRLFGVEILQEGSVFSINDIYSENTIQYIAKDMDPMIGSGNEHSWKRLLFEKQVQGKLIDHHYATMLRQRQKLENEIASLNNQIMQSAQSIGPEYENNLKTMLKSPKIPGESKTSIRKEAVIKSRKQAQLLQGRRDLLLQEINRLDVSINRYEHFQMTWDMNASLNIGKLETNNLIKNGTSPSVTELNIKNLGDVNR